MRRDKERGEERRDAVERKERGKEMEDGGSSLKRNPARTPLVATLRTLSAEFLTINAVLSREITSLYRLEVPMF